MLDMERAGEEIAGLEAGEPLSEMVRQWTSDGVAMICQQRSYSSSLRLTD